MRSSEVRRTGHVVAIALALALALVACSRGAGAQQRAQGFAVERFYGSAPGGGWLVMDSLDMQGGLGGAMAVTLGYSHAPLRVPPLAVVSGRAFAAYGFAATYDRFRLYLNLEMPLVATGQSGSAGGYTFTAPSIDPASHPDTLSDPRIGFDVRLFGRPDGPIRVGLGTQLYVPNGLRADYVSDHTYRTMTRALFAGDRGWLTYAGQVGIHFRPLDEARIPGSPRGSELLFGIAAGPRFTLATNATVAIGPEIFGETGVHHLFRSAATGVEALLTGRIEVNVEPSVQARAKLGAGGGLNPELGAAEWRSVFSIEVAGRRQ